MVWLVVWAASSEVLIGKKIIIVDDDRLVLRGLSRCLKQAGFETIELLVERNQRMEEVLGQIVPTRFDALISDVDMSFSGLDLVAAMRQAGIAKPIIVHSGWALGHVGNAMLASGSISAFLQKPYAPNEMVDELNRLMPPPPDGASGE